MVLSANDTVIRLPLTKKDLKIEINNKLSLHFFSIQKVPITEHVANYFINITNKFINLCHH